MWGVVTSPRLMTTSTTRATPCFCCAPPLSSLPRPVVSRRARHLDDHAARGSLRRSGVQRVQRFTGSAELGGSLRARQTCGSRRQHGWTCLSCRALSFLQLRHQHNRAAYEHVHRSRWWRFTVKNKKTSAHTEERTREKHVFVNCRRIEYKEKQPRKEKETRNTNKQKEKKKRRNTESRFSFMFILLISLTHGLNQVICITLQTMT